MCIRDRVDADRIDAQNFPDGAADRYMAQCAKLADLGACFDAHMAKLQESAKPTPVSYTHLQVLLWEGAVF